MPSKDAAVEAINLIGFIEFAGGHAFAILAALFIILVLAKK